MKTPHSLRYLWCAATAVSVASAQSWNTIPEIEVFGQHFFYSNNGSQLYVSPLNCFQNRLNGKL